MLENSGNEAVSDLSHASGSRSMRQLARLYNTSSTAVSNSACNNGNLGKLIDRKAMASAARLHHDDTRPRGDRAVNVNTSAAGCVTCQLTQNRVFDLGCDRQVRLVRLLTFCARFCA